MMIRYEIKRVATAEQLKKQLSTFFIKAFIYKSGAKYKEGAILEVSEHYKEAVDELLSLQGFNIEYER